MNDLEERLTRALAARAETVQAGDLRPAAPPAEVVPLRRRRTTIAVLASVAAVAALVVGVVVVRGLGGPDAAPGPSTHQRDTHRRDTHQRDTPTTRHDWPRDGLPAILPSTPIATAPAGTAYTAADGTVARVRTRHGVDRLLVTAPGEVTQSATVARGHGVVGSLAVEKVQLDLGPSTVAAYPRDSMGYVVNRGFRGGDENHVLVSQAGALAEVAPAGAVPFDDLTRGGRSYVTFLSDDGHFYTLVRRLSSSDSFHYRAWQWTLTAGENTTSGPALTSRPLGAICLDNVTGEFGRCS